MNRKNILTGVAAAMMSALLLTGCGGGDKAAAPAKDGDKGKIVVGLDDNFPPMGFKDEKNEIVGFDVDKTELTIPEKIELLPEEELRQFVTDHEITVVAGTVGEDEHSVGMREILDIKHGGLEKYGVKYHYLGTSVPVEKMVDAAIESGSDAILISTVISHNEVHRTMMKKLAELTKERGIRDEKVLIAGGTQVSRDMAAETGLDATFGRGTKGIDVLDAIVRTMRGREQEKVG